MTQHSPDSPAGAADSTRPSRIGTVSWDSRMSGAGGRVALKVEMAVSITDLIALTSVQSAGGLGFAAANCGGLVSSFARMD